MGIAGLFIYAANLTIQLWNLMKIYWQHEHASDCQELYGNNRIEILVETSAIDKKYLKNSAVGARGGQGGPGTPNFLTIVFYY